MSTILALGDSYTSGESVEIKESFPHQLAHFLGNINEIKTVARTGWRTDNLLDAIHLQNLQKKFDYVFLLIGVNNQFQNRNIDVFESEFDLLIAQAKKYAKNESSIFVITIPDYGFSVFGKPNQNKISEEINNYNSLIKNISGNQGFKYVDITPISKTEDADFYASDGLHPSGLQYKKWAEKIFESMLIT